MLKSKLPIYNLVAGILWNKEVHKLKALDRFQEKFNKIHLESPTFTFQSTFYNQEMGNFLKKSFLFFNTKIKSEDLWQVKTISNQIEAELSLNNQRQINLDPGALSNFHLILLSTKPYAHRIPLKKGIWAEQCYLFEKNKVKTLPWTYPDYQSDLAKEFFLKARSLCMTSFN